MEWRLEGHTFASIAHRLDRTIVACHLKWFGLILDGRLDFLYFPDYRLLSRDRTRFITWENVRDPDEE